MKLKINKATDFSSISVLPPPQSRRMSSVQRGPQPPQIRSEPSQQSASQGISQGISFSSQLGMFSQNSLDEPLTNDRRFSSQEREYTFKRTSGLPSIGYMREENQMPISRANTNLMRKWNAGPAPDHKVQTNEDLDHRIALMETSLNKFGMILDSIQSDVMQVNKGTKEVTMETGSIRQKLMLLDVSTQTMNKVLEDVKYGLDESLKSISEQLKKDVYQDKLQQIFMVLAKLPEQIEASLQKSKNELRVTLTKEIQAMASNLKTLDQKSPSIAPLQPKVTNGISDVERKPEMYSNQKSPSITLLHPKVTGSCTFVDKKPVLLKNSVIPPKVGGRTAVAPKAETGGWKSVKGEDQTTFTRKTTQRLPNPKPDPPVQLQKAKQRSESRVVIESDEDIDGGFSCLIDDKQSGIGNHLFDDVKEETQRILRRARREKRKYNNPIIIN